MNRFFCKFLQQMLGVLSSSFCKGPNRFLGWSLLRTDLRRPERGEGCFREAAGKLPRPRPGGDRHGGGNKDRSGLSSDDDMPPLPTGGSENKDSGVDGDGENDSSMEEQSAPAAGRVPVEPLATMRAVLPVAAPAPCPPRAPPRRPDQKSSGTKKDPFCRRCGRYKQSDPLARGKHAKRKGKSTRSFCRVHPSDYEPTYPKQGYECTVEDVPFCAAGVELD